MTAARCCVLVIGCFLFVDRLSAAESEASQNLAVVTASRSIGVQFEIRVGDQSLVQAWNEQLFRPLFAFFDRNGDGVLDAREARRVPSPALLRNQLRSDWHNIPETKDNRATQQESRTLASFGDNDLQHGLIELSPHAAESTLPADRRLSRLLFDGLAQEQGSLGPTSFATLQTLFQKLDLDEDERIALAELTTDMHRVPLLKTAPVKLAPKQTTQPIDVRVGLDFIGVEPGRLNPQDFSAGKGRWLSEDKRTAAIDDLQLRVELIPGQTDGFETGRQELSQQFDNDDVDDNRLLDAHEIAVSTWQAAWISLVENADRNDDGKLAELELTAYVDLLKRGAQLLLYARVVDHGRPLWETLDVDLDQRLSLRELKTSWSRISAWDYNNDGRVEWAEIPESLVLQISRGRPRMMTTTKRETSVPLSGPTWFLKMDRNRDGDVSPREFIGTSEDFQRFDLNGDGLLDPTEAAAIKAR